MTQVTDQLTASAVICFLLQVLKQSKLAPWINAQTDALNRVLAIVLSAIAALGIHWSFDQAGGVLTVTGLTWSTIGAGGWEVLKQYAITEGWYRATVKRVNGAALAPRP